MLSPRTSHGKRKNGNIMHKLCTEKRINTFLKDFSISFNNHGWHGLFSLLSSLPISVLRNLQLDGDLVYKLRKIVGSNIFFNAVHLNNFPLQKEWL